MPRGFSINVSRAESLKKWMRFNKTIMVAVMLVASCATLAGCSVNLGLTRQKEAADATADYNPEIVKQQKDLEDGVYYVEHDNTFARLYIGKASFKQDDEVNDNDTTRVVWFQDDFEKIPTLYTGDSLIYKTNTDLNREFGFERFNYLGYTIGVSNLQKTLSGRYAIENNNENAAFFCPQSDAERLLDMKGSPIVIDRIGNGDLRSGNISDAGTVIGLSKDKVYEADIYIGSKIYPYKLKADVIAMYSSDYQDSVNYSYLQSDIIEVAIPENFNTGYYKMPDGGIFRYVKGTSYDENVDFNIANMDYDDYLESLEENQMDGVDAENNQAVKEVGIEKDGKYVVTVVFSKDNVNDSLPEPEAVLAGSDQSEDLVRQSNGDLKYEGELKAGNYTLTVTSLYGRTCTVQVEEVVSDAEQ